VSRAFWIGFVHGNVVIGQFLAENVRGLLVLAGSAWIYIGVAGFSRPAAHIFGGALLAALGAFPYLRQRKH
jgi:hypothetical protein